MPSNIWIPGVIERIPQYLDDNEVTCTLRRLDKTAASLFAHRILVRLSQPVPCHEFHNHCTQPNAMRTFSYYERRKLLALTAASGCLPSLKVAVQHAGCDLAAKDFGYRNNKGITVLEPLTAAAAAAGHIHVCKWLVQNGYVLRHFHLCIAAGDGRQETCAWLLDHGCPWDEGAVYAATSGGHSGLMEWLLARDPSNARRRNKGLIVMAAAVGCDLPTFKRLYQHWLGDSDNMNLHFIAAAAALGSRTSDWQAKFLWLKQMDLFRGDSYYEEPRVAASCPDAVERLQWMQARGFKVATPGAATGAIETGNMAALEYVISLDAREFQANTASYAAVAAEHGQLAALKLLQAYGPLDSPQAPNQCISMALKSGRMEVVAWLVEAAGVTLEQLQQAVRDSLTRRDDLRRLYVCSAAYRVELLEWLHARGCRLSEENALPALNYVKWRIHLASLTNPTAPSRLRDI